VGMDRLDAQGAVKVGVQVNCGTLRRLTHGITSASEHSVMTSVCQDVKTFSRGVSSGAACAEFSVGGATLHLHLRPSAEICVLFASAMPTQPTKKIQEGLDI
jgi:hypothetical protein